MDSKAHMRTQPQTHHCRHSFSTAVVLLRISSLHDWITLRTNSACATDSPQGWKSCVNVWRSEEVLGSSIAIAVLECTWLASSVASVLPFELMDVTNVLSISPGTLTGVAGGRRTSGGDECFCVSRDAHRLSSRLRLPLANSLVFQRRIAFTGGRMLTLGRAVTVRCSNNAEASPLPEKRVLVGCGSAALDFLASVDKFPQPDDKIRSTELQVQGGGNVGNALTAAARLGLECRIFTKVANDGPGSQILAELQGDGVDVSNVVVAEGVSPFTFVIVDKETNTRTCIHTPGSPALIPQELTSASVNSLLNEANLVYFDGRLADTAIVLAEEASKRQLPILVDAERLREGLDDLLSYATYVVASAKFPQSWTSAPTVAEALVKMMLQLPRLKFVIVTLGASGCIMLERHASDASEAEIEDGSVEVNSLVESLSREAGELCGSSPNSITSKVCKLSIANNSDVQQHIWGRFHVGTAETIPASELVDTTGAGDGFIGGVMYAILAGLSAPKMLALGATVGAGSCRALGARPGLPTRADPKVASFL
uniref:Carbohydrate kinase PfkB domain-containing protein n=3 Tax=Physcomitrium patens TaxID=3218 RepID=A0A7I4B7S4_PHYPA|nr:ribokinase-like isoform X1 [Physcomitrium patens]|eukprot:XP_024398785.1 ribokinase-like isoform X1 [Physcomitrella patens]